MATYCKISLMRGDITKAPTDIIVNAANKHLCGGSGVDGAIHKAAGPGLVQECMKIGACATGHAVVTRPYNIKQAKAIIHTVGPRIISGHVKGGQMIRKVDYVDEKLLENCYINSLNLAVSLKIQCQSITFPCISTGVYGYPKQEAAKVAIKAIRQWLKQNDRNKKLQQIIFCTFMKDDYDIYKCLLPQYFNNTGENLTMLPQHHQDHKNSQKNFSFTKSTQAEKTDKEMKNLIKSLSTAKENLRVARNYIGCLETAKYNGHMVHTPQELYHTASSLKSQVDDILQRLDIFSNTRF